jgi:hypothetical protein
MKRVTGIGGVFFKTDDPGMIRTCYARHLGIGMQDKYGADFTWGKAGTDEKGSTVWSPLKRQLHISNQVKRTLCSTTG